MNYLSAENLSKSFGEQTLFEGLSFGLEKGDKTALIAKNGTGKTTLLKILMGKMTPDNGEFTIRKGIKTAFLEQTPNLNDSLTIDQLILTNNTAIHKLIKAYERALEDHSISQTTKTAKTLEDTVNAMDQANAWDYERRLKQLLDLFKITDTKQTVSTLSGGEKKRLALAIILLDEPELLILDEPTNHLDIEMIEWLERYLSRASLTLLMVTHDRYFLNRVCNHIIELDRGNLYHYHGNYELFLEKKAERELLQKTETQKAGQLLKKELDWLRRSPKARTGKSKARIDAIDTIKEKATQSVDNSELRLQVKAPRLGGKILEMDKISKSYESHNIIKDFSYKFSKTERLGIIGRNGTGKTSFLNLITGTESPNSGTMDIGETIVMGYFKQSEMEWRSEQRVIDEVKEIAEVVLMADGKTISASQFLEHFMFTPEFQYKPISKLSGGELRRLQLLKVLIKNPNFLILDEPTNDLDLLALNKLEEFLLTFKGILVIVSHDRYFLDKLTDHLFIFEGEGKIKDHYGTYTSYRTARELNEKSRKNELKNTSGKKQISKKNSGENKIKTKLSFKEKQEYASLETEIEELEEEKQSLEKELTEGKLGYEALEQKSKRVAVIIDSIEIKLQRWMELGEYDS